MLARGRAPLAKVYWRHPEPERAKDLACSGRVPPSRLLLLRAGSLAWRLGMTPEMGANCNYRRAAGTLAVSVPVGIVVTRLVADAACAAAIGVTAGVSPSSFRTSASSLA